MLELQKDKTISDIISRFADKTFRSRISIGGNWASFANCLACCLSKHTSRDLLVISPHIEDADRAYEDMVSFSASKTVNIPAWDGGQDLSGCLDEVAAARYKAFADITTSKEPLVINASIQALLQPVIDLKKGNEGSLKIFQDQTIEPELVESWLFEEGFERVECVDMPGQFARRGGIIDIFSPIANFHHNNGKNETGAVAVRLDFFGDTIESMRLINLDNQHSLNEINVVEIFSGSSSSQSKSSLFDIISPDTIVMLNEPVIIQETAEIFCSRVSEDTQLFDWPQLYRNANKFGLIEISRFNSASNQNNYQVPVTSVEAYTCKSGSLWSGHKQALMDLAKEAKNGKKVLLFCENEGNKNRVREIVTKETGKFPRNIKLINSMISGGFEITTLKTIVISHHEIFGQDSLIRRTRSLKPAAPIDNFLDLAKGDYVVHIAHGIGRFEGITTIEKDEQISEYLTIEFADNARIHVPVSSIDLVHKYVGTTPLKPKLNKLGGKKWQNQKQKVEDSVEDMAVELLELQAKRQQTKGIQFDPDSQWQIDFESSFPYQETPDQLTAVERIKKDMQSSRPMDMLLCGDVGYGKTEIAMRAAFKAVQSGKQVAMLVPTTVLCVQHGRTFAERLADFPVNIETLNRFKSSSQAAKILEGAKNGRVDILIGTHRLLSKDVGFKDLGLLIIDEEQRFGVAHKEKLKMMRVNVDVLTLTATPIPRTLHLSLLGLRDITTLSTPPLDRRSVATSVNRHSDDLIRSVINRELRREGQVFFLHNRVKSIERTANDLRAMFPDAGIKVAHGQMAKHQLEKAMIDFVTRKTDILVCTTIIESGLDIPSANTIVIDHADKFGLAQLHQLRGRVGRYKYRAYAQLLLPPDRPIKPIAARRLKAIEEFSQLGAGFKIALRDLEIRGAGNILGAEQSGHIDLVGYELYCKLLSDAVKRLKNEPIDMKPQTVLNLGFTSHIPKSYISSDRQRMAVYRKISAASTTKDLKNLEAELKDLFGKVPQEVILLLDTADIRVRAAKYSIRAINAVGNDLVFSFPPQKSKGRSNVSKAADIFAKVSSKITIPDPNTLHLKLSAAHFEPTTLLAKLRAILK
ncbi:MAG: transcription-repair coupling factor [Sedimentisphaeraceae bacterium JB056]